MEWWFRYGDKAEWLENLEREGHKVPALENKPILFLDLSDIWEAFQALNCSRDSGFAAGPIKYREMLAYFIMHKIPEYQWPEYSRWIKKLDLRFLELEAEKEEK